jgi:YesN/AraC family two-component response regulator
MENFINFKLDYFVLRNCRPDWQLPENVIYCNGLVLVLEGELTYTYNHQKLTVTAGDLLFFQPGTIRQAHANTSSTIVAFDFTTNNFTVELANLTHLIVTEELIQLIKQFQYIWLQKGSGWELETSGLFLMILNHLREPKLNESNLYIQQIKHFIIEHFSEHLTVDFIASQIGLNPVYCGALFKANQNISILEFIRKCRVEQASSLLHYSGLTISEIAENCGFTDVYMFSKTFKKYFGKSPKHYREQIQHTLDSHKPAQ